MITYVRGHLKEVRCRGKLSAVRDLPVNLLLETWEISAAELDRAAALYLAPSLCRNVDVRQYRSRGRSGSAEELEIFRLIRTHHLFFPRHKST